MEECEVRQAGNRIVQSTVARSPLIRPALGECGVTFGELVLKVMAFVDLVSESIVNGHEIGRSG
jgi:hypothetical protein